MISNVHFSFTVRFGTPNKKISTTTGNTLFRTFCEPHVAVFDALPKQSPIHMRKFIDSIMKLWGEKSPRGRFLVFVGGSYREASHNKAFTWIMRNFIVVWPGLVKAKKLHEAKAISDKKNER